MNVSRHPWRSVGRTLLLSTSLCASLGMPSLSASAQQAEPPTRGPFVDVPRNHWAYEAVEELRQRGILLGYSPTPERPATAPAPKRRQAQPTPPVPRSGRGHPERRPPRR
jgi:hypothetical protein